MITVDSSQASGLARWWARQLDREVLDVGEGWFLMVRPAEGQVALTLGFQQVAEPTPGKNRLHLDLATSDREAEVARLLADGATFVADHALPHGLAWTVLQDPDGNEFCVSAADAH